MRERTHTGTQDGGRSRQGCAKLLLSSARMLLRHAPAAQSVKLFRSWTPSRRFWSAPLFKGLAQDLESMAPALGQFIQEAHAWCTSDTSPGSGTWPPLVSPHRRWCDGGHGTAAW